MHNSMEIVPVFHAISLQKCIKYGAILRVNKSPCAPKPLVLNVSFYQTEAGAEPVREWLKDLHAHERHAIGEDIKAV